MDYVAGNRIVTGSDYAEDAFCMPYPFDPTQSLWHRKTILIGI